MPELAWEGKYDKDGRRVAPLRVSLPFQTVETVNKSSQERQQTLDFTGRQTDTEWRNRLICGDNKSILPALLRDFAQQVWLAYIDPPFASGQDFSLTARSWRARHRSFDSRAAKAGWDAISAPRLER